MPEFPLSKPDIIGSNPPPRERKRDSNSERRWRLVQVSHYANLQPSQIVREMDAPDRGWNPDYNKGHEHSPRAVRQDGTADADRQRENTPEPGQVGPRTVDERRYVVDPIVDGHTFEGLWTGGPVQHMVVQGHKVLRQTLTRTWCAGHGYTVNEDGAYVAVWRGGKPDGIGGVHGTSGNDDSDADPPVREYRTAKECLKECRPWMDGRLSPYMAFRTDIPSSFTREVYWREFTHESITPLESLSRNDLVEIVSYHFGEKVGPTVMDAHTRVDPNTNTVIFVCSLLYTELAEPATPEDLLELPCIDGPCERETLRMFGWNQMRDGEGYEYKHYYRWPRLKDTPKTRKTIEFVCDNKALTRAVRMPDDSDSDSEPEETFAQAGDSFLVALLARHRHNDKKPGWWTDYEQKKDVTVDNGEMDKTGRLATKAEINDDSDSAADEDVPVQHYRIADQKVDVADDGSITFTIIVAKSEWHGCDDGKDWENGGTRQLASVSNPQGYGITEHRVIPSVPRDNAIPTMNAITPGDYEVISNKQQTEGQKGSSDVSFQKQKLYDYISDPGEGHTPDDIVNIDGTVFNAPRYTYDPETNVYSLTYNLVKPDMVQALVTRLRNLLGDPKVSINNDGNGSYTVSVKGKGLNPRHVAEFVVEADWYQHQTLEQWIGVVVKRDGDDSDSGTILGFWTKYKQTVEGGAHILVPDETAGSFIPLEAVRGDLDADWMGSDPQSVGPGPRSPVLYYSIGVDNDKELRRDINHDDEHGDGWEDSDWDDPDGAGDSADKARSHALTRVHPRINGDGTMDLSITRIYPHQRYTTWQTKIVRKKGAEWKTVFHADYRNWPSRHAIHADIVTRFAKECGISEQDTDYIINFNPTVNQFGLIDAPNVTIQPQFWNNSSRSRNEHGSDTVVDMSDYQLVYAINGPRQSQVAPNAAPMKPAMKPFSGRYFAVRYTPIFSGSFKTDQQATGLAKATAAWNELINGPSQHPEKALGQPDTDKSEAPHHVGSGIYEFYYVGTYRYGPWYHCIFPMDFQKWNAQTKKLWYEG